MIEYLACPAETSRFGRRLAAALVAEAGGAVVTLAGELGAGKTALVRAVITALDYAGVVVSPSYTLIETYELAGRRLHHLDLYRISDPEELEFLGVRGFSIDNDFVFVEWAERGLGFLPTPDLAIVLEYEGCGRKIALEAHSASGRRLISKL